MKNFFSTALLLLLTCLCCIRMFAQNVGVGTTTPQAKLEIRSPIKAAVKVRSENYNDTTQLILSNRNASEEGTDFILSSNRENGLRISTSSDVTNYNNDSILMITPLGNIGIGNAIPSERLDVRGNVNVSGTIKANGVDGNAGQVLMKNSSGNLAWGNVGDYKELVTFISGSGIWTIPAGVTKVMVEVWGGGGGGNVYMGGGGGAYVMGVMNVVSGNLLSYGIGTAGTGATSNANSGATSYVVYGSSISLVANGGLGANYSTGPPVGLGGGTGGSFTVAGTTAYIGQNGGVGEVVENKILQTSATQFYENTYAGRGGHAGNTNNTGGNGGYGLINLNTSTVMRIKSGSTGLQPGGGGGAGFSFTAGGAVNPGASGGAGMVVIRY